MHTYILRVRLQNGSFTEMPFTAYSASLAITICESQFGAGSYMGLIREA